MENIVLLMLATAVNYADYEGSKISAKDHFLKQFIG